MTEEARGEVYDITDQMADLERRIQGIGLEQQGVAGQVSVILAKALVDVAGVRDQGGNLAYPDQQLREAAVTL